VTMQLSTPPWLDTHHLTLHASCALLPRWTSTRTHARAPLHALSPWSFPLPPYLFPVVPERVRHGCPQTSEPLPSSLHRHLLVFRRPFPDPDHHRRPLLPGCYRRRRLLPWLCRHRPPHAELGHPTGPHGRPKASPLLHRWHGLPPPTQFAATIGGQSSFGRHDHSHLHTTTSLP
jgi:hypothetical protein